MLQSGIRKPSRLITKEKYRLVISRFNILTPLAIAMLFLTQMLAAQQPATQNPADKKTDKKADKKAEEKAVDKKTCLWRSDRRPCDAQSDPQDCVRKGKDQHHER
jgi:hypothetical protein